MYLLRVALYKLYKQIGPRSVFFNSDYVVKVEHYHSIFHLQFPFSSLQHITPPPPTDLQNKQRGKRWTYMFLLIGLLTISQVSFSLTLSFRYTRAHTHIHIYTHTLSLTVSPFILYVLKENKFCLHKCKCPSG